MPTRDPLETVTHARLRAEQGDVRGARRILERMLVRDPDDPTVHALLRDLDGRGQVERATIDDVPEAPPASASAEELASRFRAGLRAASGDRAARLRRYLRRIESGRASGRQRGGRP
jgi:hypothetical protein